MPGASTTPPRELSGGGVNTLELDDCNPRDRDHHWYQLPEVEVGNVPPVLRPVDRGDRAGGITHACYETPLPIPNDQLNQLEERGLSYSNSVSGLGLNANDENYAAEALLKFLEENKENHIN